MKRFLYRFLLYLHPPDFRERFAAEMLWIFDEAPAQAQRAFFTDAFVSVLKQWILHSGLWKAVAGACFSFLFLFGWWHSQEISLAAALRRGNPAILEDIHHQNAPATTCAEISGQPVPPVGNRAAAAAPLQDPRLCDLADAIPGIIAAFKQHAIVAIGEAHWIHQAGNFYVQLIRDPAFQETVQDIVVEFASRNNQPLLDKYISGEDLPTQDVQRIWRDTTKVASWESPIYAQWLAAIRKVNHQLPPSRHLRVLAGDNAVDWSVMRTHADWMALGDNNVSVADVIVNEVLKHNHHALVVLGSNHVIKSGDRNGGPNAITRIESRYPGSTYVVLLDTTGLIQPAVQELMHLHLLVGERPALCELSGTQLGNVMDENGTRLIKKADALLYLGSPQSFAMAPPPPGSFDREYLQEIDRRSAIEWGALRARKFLGPAAQ
jgi:hypothetical protein